MSECRPDRSAFSSGRYLQVMPRPLLATVTLATAALAAGLLAAPAPAPASAGTQVDTFMQMGRTFWADRGVTICERPEAHITPLPDQVAGVQANGCAFWLSSTLVRRAERERWKPGRGSDSYREELCTTVFHELGHTAGLGHTDTGLMSEVSTVVPGACQTWVRRQVRQERQAYRDGRRDRGRMSG